MAGYPLFSPPTVFFSTSGFTLLEGESTEAEIWRQGSLFKTVVTIFSPTPTLYSHAPCEFLLTLQCTPQSRPLLAGMCLPYFINSEIQLEIIWVTCGLSIFISDQTEIKHPFWWSIFFFCLLQVPEMIYLVLEQSLNH